MVFNEDSRVKIPAILHLCRLGYEYLPLSQAQWDRNTNIFTDILKSSILRLNPGLQEQAAGELITRITLALDNEDLGKSFHELITDNNGPTLIDFDNFSNNQLQVVTELPCINQDDQFRPDITLLINGMPLVFIEVKKPNNLRGIQDEFNRMKSRFGNPRFRRFANVTQLMVFSNNMEYADDGSQPLQGAFYATPAYGELKFNYFREEEPSPPDAVLKHLPDETEVQILLDNNLASIRQSPEFITNKNPETPTNRICTSLLHPDRLAFLLQFALVYVKGKEKLEKHIMRYPQFFATKAIGNHLDKGKQKGIIWHTQGSGKTALACYNVKFLTHYFRKKSVIPKFYFIVDRIDLLVQASNEFESRGLTVHHVNSRDEFVKDLKTTTAIHNNSGKPEITVVNIQRFREDRDVVSRNDYNVSIQRVYFLDEVHRSYNPKGSFLANLNESDVHAIKIGLTGTPLLGTDFNSRLLFGDYIHKYYYNASIADGYTLRLIREDIETSYQIRLKAALEEINILKGEGDRKTVYAHDKFVAPLLEYIVSDFQHSRSTLNDHTIGGMVICDSKEQAENMKRLFDLYYANADSSPLSLAADSPMQAYIADKAGQFRVRTAEVVLHDTGSKSFREGTVKSFKNGEIDLLFVYKMLITGFDAPRLKKLYLTRIIKAHNLLQAITRVNRTYGKHQYGYVVDFADIQREFDKTNLDYYNELRGELGDEMEHYSNIFKSREEIERDISQIKEVLFLYDTQNAEVFSTQISGINDKEKVLELAKALKNVRELYNLIRLSGHHDMLDRLDFHKIAQMARVTNERLALINSREALASSDAVSNLLNIALEEVLFGFTKVKEEEMIIADQLKSTLQKTRLMLGGNFDQQDPAFVTLREELERLFKKKNLNEVSHEEMEQNIRDLGKIYDQARELDRKNMLLKAKYHNDAKYARLHKRLMEKDPLTDSESKLFEVLQSLKQELDAHLIQNDGILENENFAGKMIQRLVIAQLKNKFNLTLDPKQYMNINHLIVREYLNEFHGRVA